MSSNMEQAAQQPSTEDLFTVGYEKAVGLLHECCAPDGFLASSTDRDNYRRVWARDGGVIGLAALRTGDAELIDCFRRTLETLARHAGPHGEIPSNYDPKCGKATYGGLAGHVDSDLWFIIGCGQYARATGDEPFLRRVREAVERAYFLLGAWEFNARGLIYVPHTGGWADEFIQSGYVLYAQVLYLQVHREVAEIRRRTGHPPDPDLQGRIAHLTRLIHDNYWFTEADEPGGEVYDETLHKKGRNAAPRRVGRHWMPFFSPAGYGYRFAAWANALVSLLGVAKPEEQEMTDDTIARSIVQERAMLLPSFYPVITPSSDLWRELQMEYSYSFKNEPYQYQNGGLWPLVTGFYAADLAGRGKKELAARYLQGIYRACSLEMDGRAWSFPEYLHGRDHTAQGTPHQGWSGAAAILAAEALRGNRPFEY